MTDQPTELVHVAPTVMQMKHDFKELQLLKTEILKTGVDYGRIPGCGDKPTLLKPGAEKVLKRFQVHVTSIEVEDLSGPDERRYRVKCIGTTPDGVIRGIGIGECSSDEDKFRWKRTNPAEFEHTQDSRKRIKYYADYEQPQVRTNPADQANTVLKIAKKRALVDLALTACAASEFFTQDLEDIQDDDGGNGRTSTRQPAPNGPSPKQRVWTVAKEAGLEWSDVLSVANELQLPSDSKHWTVRQVEQACEKLQARAKAKTFEQPPEEPPPEEPAAPMEPVSWYEVALQKSTELGRITDEQWDAASEKAGTVGLMPDGWTQEDCDRQLAALKEVVG